MKLIKTVNLETCVFSKSSLRFSDTDGMNL